MSAVSAALKVLGGSERISSLKILKGNNVFLGMHQRDDFAHKSEPPVSDNPIEDRQKGSGIFVRPSLRSVNHVEWSRMVKSKTVGM